MTEEEFKAEWESRLRAEKELLQTPAFKSIIEKNPPNSSSIWHGIFYIEPWKLHVIDPDGWDRKNFDESWAEKITYAEYLERCGHSTCGWMMWPILYPRERERRAIYGE